VARLDLKLCVARLSTSDVGTRGQVAMANSTVVGRLLPAS
jgi:hypothetical protein